MAGIFISYRRDDSAGYAMLLRDRLEAEFGETHPIFLDVEAIEPGDDFVEIIEKKLASSRVLVAVIGKNWLAAKRDDKRVGGRRDYVHFEIQNALDRKIRVIPALVGGGRMPRPEDLPPPLARFAHCQALEIGDGGFNHGIQRLIDALKKALSPTRKTPASAELQPKGAVSPKIEQPIAPSRRKAKDGPDGLPYVWIPSFSGPPKSSLGDFSLHGFVRPSYEPPRVRQGFWISELFVTNRDYFRATGAMPTGGRHESALPALLSYWEASEYCRKIEGRLPTWAEWKLVAEGLEIDDSKTPLWTSDSDQTVILARFLRPCIDHL